MTRTYLATVCIDGSTKSVASAPVKDCTFLVPTFSVSDCEEPGPDDFEFVSILTSGEVVFESRFLERTNVCLLTTVPILYPSSVQSSIHGDMESELCGTYVSNINVWRTKPYPSDPASIVVFSGSVKVDTELFQLESTLWPSKDMMFPANGGVVTVSRKGVVSFVSESSTNPSLVSLDNVRYPLTETSIVQASSPHRSHLIVNGPLHAKGRSLFFPIVSQTKDKSVAIISPDEPVFIENDSLTPLIVSSMFASSQPGHSTWATQQIAEQMMGEGHDALVDAVAARLGGLVFARLSGESEFKCLRRDRGWRQTGIKNAPIKS